jgi:hypothetical protein
VAPLQIAAPSALESAAGTVQFQNKSGFESPGPMEGKMTRICFAICLALGIASAQAQTMGQTTMGQTTMSQSTGMSSPCRADKVLNTNGVYIKLASGQVFQAYPGNGPALSGWLPLDKVSVCKIGGTGVQITNLSKNGASVNALYLPGQRGPF